MSSARMYQHDSTGRIYVTFDFGDLKSENNIEHFKWSRNYILQTAVGNILELGQQRKMNPFLRFHNSSLRFYIVEQLSVGQQK